LAWRGSCHRAEPLPLDHPLVAEPNCFITPHVAGGHAEETETIVSHFLENFRRFLGEARWRIVFSRWCLS